MKNKGFLILLILVIFCMGVSIESASANELDSNLTFSDNSSLNQVYNDYINVNCPINQTKDDGICNSEDVKFEEKSDVLSYSYPNYIQQKITILTKNYNSWNNKENLEVETNGPDTIYYEIYDDEGEIVYSHEQYVISDDYFSSNYDIFKNLPNGNYVCKLYSEDFYNGYDNIIGTEKTWNVVKTTIKPKTTKSKSDHHAKYIKVGKYKVKVWSDDSLNTKKNKVIKYLNKHVKKAHTFKIKGYKFKVSAKMYRKILYYKKFGYDGKVGYSNFKVKTNKVIKYKMPIFKTVKVKKTKWAYKSVWTGSNYYDGYNHYLRYKPGKDVSKYFDKGWKYSHSFFKSARYGIDGTVDKYYSVLKKKVKYTVDKDVKIGYKTVKLRVYAWGVETHLNVGVQFRGTGNGYKNFPITSYYMF